MDNTIDRIKQLLIQKGISGAKMSRDLGLSNAAFSQWNTGKTKPSAETLLKIADYFNVNLDYLLTRTDDPSPLPSLGPGLTALMEDLSDTFAVSAEPALDLSDLSEEDIKQVEEYIEFLRLKRKKASK